MVCGAQNSGLEMLVEDSVALWILVSVFLCISVLAPSSIRLPHPGGKQLQSHMWSSQCSKKIPKVEGISHFSQGGPCSAWPHLITKWTSKSNLYPKPILKQLFSNFSTHEPPLEGLFTQMLDHIPPHAPSESDSAGQRCIYGLGDAVTAGAGPHFENHCLTEVEGWFSTKRSECCYLKIWAGFHAGQNRRFKLWPSGKIWNPMIIVCNSALSPSSWPFLFQLLVAS